MNSLDANIRDNKSKGQLNAIRSNGDVPAIIYGGKNRKSISISKKLLKVLIEKREFFVKYNYSKCKWSTSECFTKRGKISYHI